MRINKRIFNILAIHLNTKAIWWFWICLKNLKKNLIKKLNKKWTLIKRTCTIWFLTVNVCVPMNLLAWGLRSSALLSFIFHGNLIQYITKLLSRVIDQYLCSLTITIKILSTQAPSGGWKTFKITKIRDDLELKSFSF